MDALQNILGRRSPGKLGEPGPNKEQMDLIIRAAAHAPDHGRLAPWRFAVLQGAGRERLASAIEELLRRRHPDATADMIAVERAKAFRAPVIVAVAAHLTSGHKVPEIEQWLAVGAAVQNMLLAARALGFGSLWKTGGPAHDASVRAALGFEPAEQIAGFIYLGVATAEPKPRDVTLEGLVRHL